MARFTAKVRNRISRLTLPNPTLPLLRVFLWSSVMSGENETHRATLIARSFLFLSMVCCVSLHADETPEPDGYRMEYYDDLVPEQLSGASTATALDVKRMQEQGDVVVIDVLPEQRKPDFLPENQIWIPVPHRGLPGALWLPDIGFGVLSETTEKYFKHHLDAATEGRRDKAVVFYCRSDCWMSWNAAKRTLSYGYTNVYWFRDGVDDWFFEGFDFAILKPAEGTRQ